MKRRTIALTTACALVLTAASLPASARDAAKPKSRYTGEKIEIAGRNVLDILNMLGAKRGERKHNSRRRIEFDTHHQQTIVTVPKMTR